MSRSINYSKWDRFDDEDHDDLAVIESSSMTTERIGALKLEADNFFKVAEESRDPYDYKIALNQGYQIVLAELNGLHASTSNSSDLVRQLEISCKLNCSCCHLKLMLLNEAIELCTDVLTNYSSILTQDQVLRARYVRSYAYYKLGSIGHFLLAEADALLMTDLISTRNMSHENTADYFQHFTVLQEERTHLTLIKNEIQLESKCHIFKLSDSLKYKEGWLLYVQKKYNLSSIWFATQLQKFESEKKESAYSSSNLCNLYFGLAKSESALNKHFEAAKAFSDAANVSKQCVEERSLHLRAAASYFKSSHYNESITSYATALLLAKDIEDIKDSNGGNGKSKGTEGYDGNNGNDDNSDDSDDNTELVVAIANAGLGICYVKLKEYQQAVDHLKDAIGYLNDNLFVRPKAPPRKLPSFMKMVQKIPNTHDNSRNQKNLNNTSDNNVTGSVFGLVKVRVMTFHALNIEAYHLLSALESLSDAYAALRDWEKSIYTATSAVDICNEFLSVLRERNNIITSINPINLELSDTADAPITPIKASLTNNSNNNHNNSSNNISKLNNNHTNKISTKPKMKDTVISALKEDINLSEDDSNNFKIKREESILIFCKRRAFTLLSIGHMVRQVLHHDINRGGDDENNENKGNSGNNINNGGYSFTGLDIKLGSETFPSNSNKVNNKADNKNNKGGNDSNNQSTVTTITAFDKISSLWSDAASSFLQLGDLEQALSVYIKLSNMWDGIAGAKPFHPSLILVDSDNEGNEDGKQGHNEGSQTNNQPSSSSSNTNNTSSRSNSTSSNNDNNDNSINNSGISSNMLPLRPNSTDNIRRIEASTKAKEHWNSAAVTARTLCERIVITSSSSSYSSSTSPSSYSSDKIEGKIQGKIESPAKVNKKFTNNQDAMFDPKKAEFQLLAWQQVMRLQYNAGLSAMLHDLKEAERLLERAQETKEKYHSLSGAINEVEKAEGKYENEGGEGENEGGDGEKGGEIEGDSEGEIVGGQGIAIHGTNVAKRAERAKEAKKKLKSDKMQHWKNYTTLCCDISYHLGYLYVRSERVTYAIAEVEMAIGYAVYSSESKVRMRKCWGLLSLCHSACGQKKEVERALKEVRFLDDSPEVEEEVSQLLLFMEYWGSRRKRKYVIPSKPDDHFIGDANIASHPLKDKDNDETSLSPTLTTTESKSDSDPVWVLLQVSGLSMLFMLIAILIAYKF